MIHKPIQLKEVSLSFSHKTCFESFSCQISYSSRIAIIGRNGSGKSSLLNIIANRQEPSGGVVIHGEDVIKAYVPQVIENYSDLSGGQRLNRSITEALTIDPNVLLLDEPTNHLDRSSRKGLMKILQNYSGTLIVVSHDKELLRHCIDTIWHINDGKVHIFSGNYDNYIHEINLKRASIESELELLSKQKKEMHHKLMKEQQRAAKSKIKGEKKIESRKVTKMAGNLKGMGAEKSHGKRLDVISTGKNELMHRLDDLRLPEVILPKFSIETAEIGGRTLIQISGASVGYIKDKPVLSRIDFRLSTGERIAITGDNGSGKSTLIKAILDDKNIHKTGEWSVIKQSDIGYLDQHYSTLDSNKCVLDVLSELVPQWSHAQVRRHLNDFLFRKNEEVATLVSALSGGEKARLQLAQIAANPPKLLILDEVSNNLDLETKEHVIQILKAYPGAMIVISHEADFLELLGVDEILDVGKFK